MTFRTITLRAMYLAALFFLGVIVAAGGILISDGKFFIGAVCIAYSVTETFDFSRRNMWVWRKGARDDA